VRQSASLYLVFGAAIAGGCSGIVVVIGDDVYSIRQWQHIYLGTFGHLKFYKGYIQVPDSG